MPKLLLALLLLPCVCAPAFAADWPHRMGPYRDNTTTEVVRPWKEPLKAVWTKPVGEAYASPTVADGRVYIHHKLKDQNVEEVLCLEAATGKELWKFSYPHQPFESNVGNGPRGAPCIALGKLYTIGITGVLTCLNAETGAKLWQKNVLEEAGAPVMMFGVSASPLVDGNRLYIPIGAPGKAIAAFDTASGEPIWSSLDDPPTSVSPVLFQPKVAGRGTVRHLIYGSTRGFYGVRPDDGTPLWQFPLTDLLPIGTLPPPTIVGGDLVVTGSMLTGAIAFRVEDEDGERLKTVEAWRNPNVTSYFSQGVAVGDDQLYIIDAQLIPEAEIGLSCLDPKTGRELWRKDKIGTYQLNLIRTGDNKLLMLDDVNGDVILLDPNPTEYRELCRSKVSKPTIINPAVAGGRLYVRDDATLACYQLP